MTVDFTNNSNQRTPCVLVLDASYSMGTRTSTGKTRMEELNAGLVELERALKQDDTALSRVQICVVVVGGPSNSAELMLDWTDAVNFQAFPIKADGRTPLAEGLDIGLDMVELAKSNLKGAGISYTRPWMIVISDGEPTSGAAAWQSSIERTKLAEKNRKVAIFTIGVEGADMAKLSQISNVRPATMLSGMKFKELFVWLSESLSAVSRSRPGQEASLPDTDPWKNVGI
jgi:uncharacterized protein YegL